MGTPLLTGKVCDVDELAAGRASGTERLVGNVAHSWRVASPGTQLVVDVTHG